MKAVIVRRGFSSLLEFLSMVSDHSSLLLGLFQGTFLGRITELGTA